MPIYSIGKDTTISFDQDLILGPYSNNYLYNWYDGSTNPYLEISGNNLGIGSHNISVVITDSNTCTILDTMVISVLPVTGGKEIILKSQVYLYPNSLNKTLNITFINFNSGDILLKLIDLRGDEIFSEKVKMQTTETSLQINLSSIPPGIYLLKIVTGYDQKVYKIVFY
jgi:hypothetical protein